MNEFQQFGDNIMDANAPRDPNYTFDEYPSAN